LGFWTAPFSHRDNPFLKNIYFIFFINIYFKVARLQVRRKVVNLTELKKYSNASFSDFWTLKAWMNTHLVSTKWDVKLLITSKKCINVFFCLFCRINIFIDYFEIKMCDEMYGGVTLDFLKKY
jgi:hypothetical protein